MRRYIPHALALVVVLGFVPVCFGQGILIPTDRTIPPMALVDQRVKVALDDQVAVTTVKQTFQNHAHRDLEATYTFTVPKGASVKEFSMMVNGKKVKGELVEAPKAKAIYHEIVRRTQDPGLLEYIGTDVLQMRVFPVPANGKQEIEVSFTSLANRV
jgi:Ca-activated chloride channel family protein